MADLVLLGLVVAVLGAEGIVWGVGKLWDLYARILNLPILIGAVLDGAAGVFFGVGMLGSESALTAFGGFMLSVLSTFFATGSVMTWVAKVRVERDDAGHLSRPPEPQAIAGREPCGLDSPHHTTS